MVGEYQFRRPPKNFSLLYLESNEVHYMSLKVSLLLEAGCEDIQGKLHLCSRSIVFEPNAIFRPLLRMRYSAGVFLRALKNIETKKAYKLIAVHKTEKEIKAAMERGAQGITDLLQSADTKVVYKRIYETQKGRPIQTEDKICNCILIKNNNISVIQRKPISPYVIEKSDHNLIFLLNKATPASKLVRFLRLYDQLQKTTDQDKLNRSIISATCDESVEQILQQHQHQRLQANNIIRCKRILIQGTQHGLLVLLRDKVLYQPLVNCPDNATVQFTYKEVKMIQRYRRLMQHNAIELWLYNVPYSLLFVLNDYSVRESVYRAIKDKAEKRVDIKMNDIINMWTQGEITNVEYINYLNVLANRSHNDLSQYPIAPWVLHTYDSPFDLRNPDIYRDLTKPIGALNKHRLRKLKDLKDIKYKDQKNLHLYSTHYSMPGYTCYYLLRKIPQFIVRLQSGVFNPAERIFRCVQSAYYNCLNLPADFKQLIPQFYSTSCDFLVNWQHLDMGCTPNGEKIDDVKLPKWATTAQDFLLKMRSAFESDYVSAHLNDWIDLIFGFKQSGMHAVTADNTFYPLTYEDNCNFDKPMGKVQRMALQMQLTEFGQTPLLLFTDKHPTRKARLLCLDIHPSDDKQKLAAKLQAAEEQNARLEDNIDKQQHRFNKKINEKEEQLQRHVKEKKKEIEKIKAMVCLDEESLDKFTFKSEFKNEGEKDVYVKQIEEILSKKLEENQRMNLMITGLKRQFEREEQNIHSRLENDMKTENDFLADDDNDSDDE